MAQMRLSVVGFALFLATGSYLVPSPSLAAADLYPVEKVSGAELWGRPLAVGSYVNDKKVLIERAMKQAGWARVRSGRNFVRARWQAGGLTVATHIVFDADSIVVDPVSDRRRDCSGTDEQCRVATGALNRRLADLRDAIARQVHGLAMTGQGQWVNLGRN